MKEMMLGALFVGLLGELQYSRALACIAYRQHRASADLFRSKQIEAKRKLCRLGEGVRKLAQRRNYR